VSEHGRSGYHLVGNAKIATTRAACLGARRGAIFRKGTSYSNGTHRTVCGIVTHRSLPDI
jgi:hypothetical protein